MPEWEESPCPQVAPLLTGRFYETSGYDTHRARGTDDWLLIATVSGHGRFGFTGGEWVSEAGDLALLRPGTPHDYGLHPAWAHWELLWAHFLPRPHWLPWLRWPEAAPGLMRLRLTEPIVRAKIIGCFGETHRLATGALRHRDQFAMNALEQTLLWSDTQNPRAVPDHLDARVQAAMDYLCRRLSEQVTPGELAKVCALSSSRLSHLFQAQAGQTIGQFVETQRLQRARQLLERTVLPIGAIAADVGYDNPFYFSLRFKRQTGLSPRDYRRQALRALETKPNQ